MAVSFDSDNWGGFFSNITKAFRRFQFGTKAQLAFLEDLYVLVNDGIPANRAIDMLGQVATGINKEVALNLSNKISQGQHLADGMADWFAVNIVEIIRVGEEGGALNETIRSAINTLTQRGGAMGSFISAISYPLLVILMACAVIIYLNSSVFVEFKNMKPIEQWPSAGQELVATAALIQYWWWLILVGVIAIILGLRWVFNNYIGEFRPMLDSIFPFTLYRRFAAARLMETLGLLVTNGVVFKNAIKVMQYQANPYVGSHLVMMEHYLGMGKGNIADVLDTGLIDPSDILRLRILAEVKGFEHGLTRMGVSGAEKSTKAVKTIAKVLGGTLLVVGGYLIIMIVKGIYLTGMAMGSTT